jgi:transcription antitermination protein NusB
MGDGAAADPSGSAPTRRDDTRDPRASRLAVLRVLYAADLRGMDPLDVLHEQLVTEGPSKRAQRGESDPDAELAGATLDGFAITLLNGLSASLPQIDERIRRFARGWRLERMPVIDRNVLRMAVHELITEPTPVPVVLDEAVRLAAEHSTDDSGRYVNGVLASIVRDLASSAEREVPDTELPASPALDLDGGPTSPVGEVTRLGLELELEEGSGQDGMSESDPRA